jgi:NTE family protein
VNLLDGNLRRFSKKDLGSDDDLRKAVLSSASFPVAFPPEAVTGGYLTDGGVRDIAPLKPAIEAGADEIIVILTSKTAGMELVGRDKVNTALEVALRVVEIMTHEIMVNDIRTCQKVNSKLARGVLSRDEKRPIAISVIEPSTPLGDSLDFDQDTMKKQIQQGITAAQSCLGAQVVTV